MNSERMQQLLTKSVVDLCQCVIDLEEENLKLREYKTRFFKIRNLVVPDDEKRKRGRPSRASEDLF